MPRPRKLTPSYLKHPNGRGRAVWTDSAGTRRFLMLPGAFNSPESLEAFARLQLEIAVAPAAVPRLAAAGPCVAEVLLAYLKFAAGYYDDETELRQIRDAARPVRELYAMTAAAEFGPLALKACRETFVRRGWSRRYCNKQTNRIVRLFKWAAGEEIIPAAVFVALKTVAPLRRGRRTPRSPTRGCPPTPQPWPRRCPTCRRTPAPWWNCSG